jgi:predicted Fe-Mo cluster-binding NifX family protein
MPHLLTYQYASATTMFGTVYANTPREGSTMNIAIATFHNRVSPRFDFAPAYLLVRVIDGVVQERSERSMQGVPDSRRAELLAGDNVAVLLCGGIRRSDFSSITQVGIEVYPGLMGETDDILRAFLRGELPRDKSWFGPLRRGTKRRRRGRGGNRQSAGRRHSRSADKPSLNRTDARTQSD